MDKNRQKWINEIEESLENVSERLKPGGVFKVQLEQRILAHHQSKILSLGTILAIAASLLLLISVNVWIGVNALENRQLEITTSDPFEAVIDSYQLIPNTFDQIYPS